MKGLTSPEPGSNSACALQLWEAYVGNYLSKGLSPRIAEAYSEYGQVKRMIRGSGDETSFTYSQTLNRPDVQVA